MAKKKRQGHYCRICGEYKANEKFSGKGHAQHICKACMSKKNKGGEIDPEIPVADEDFDNELFGDMEYDMFNPDIDIMPSVEPEHKKYDKLNKEEKAALKELWADIVIRYWEDERLIPFGEPYSKIKRELLEIFAEQGEIALKDDELSESYSVSGEQNGINSDCSRIILRRLHYFAYFRWKRAIE